MQILKPWQREKTWIGPAGVATKHMRWACPERVGRQVKSLEDLMSRPEWRGSSHEPGTLWEKVGKGEVAVPCTVVRHPSGAVARIRHA